ncbi:transglutaminase family protein [Ruminococcus sp. 5_1_39BFAA]|uniref:transglutaminase-like domain-containing protein n=1 Tax=Ruminococcus sp. 5_1_39BFAA TaxID=457412 RepID=UPI0035660BFE
MFLERYRDRIIEEFDKFCRSLPGPSSKIQKELCTLDEDTALVMKFFYGNMPCSDVGNYSFATYLDYAQQGVYLWKNSPYCEKIPEEVFLGDVLYYRVNEEEIKPCRKFFYEKLKDRIAGMGMKDAILEVNYWCAGEVTYQSTDVRTSSAWDVFRKGYGRCGEESVFAVNALRSVGIPARQVYVPNWSHCDDNHAWVEVWCDGDWHYLGACEPEAVLDKGWFTNASSRAMMVHSRSFFDGGAEKVVGKEGIATIQNQLARYADTKTITIRVEDLDGCPVEGAKILAEVLNYSEFSPIARMVTGADGTAKLETGLGSLHIFVSSHGEYAECLIHTSEEDACCCVLGEKAAEDVWVDFDMTAPVDSVKNQNLVSREMEAENSRRVAEAAEIRKRKTEAFRPDWLGGFLAHEPEKAAEYMAVLSEKDRQDADPEILLEHYEESLVYENSYPGDIFLSYIWNPRIEFEILSKWRRRILEYFTPQQRELFREDPSEIWKWIEENLRSCTERERLTVYTVPAAALELGFAEMKSRRVLFVAIARTLGIPSRLNAVDGSMEYWKDGGFVSVLKSSEKSAHITITGEKDFSWNYFQNWSIARLEEDGYHSLVMWNVHLEKGRLELDVEPGEYRVLTSNRLPTGNIFAKRYDFHMEKGGHREIALEMREASLGDMLDSHRIPDYELKDGDGKLHSIGELTKEGRRILFWLDVSKEPTEHILNELVEKKEEYGKCQNQLLFIIRGPEELADSTLSKCRTFLPDVKVLYDVFGKDLEMTARRMYVDPDKLPLLVVTDGSAVGIFAASGYSVGMADMLLRVLKS